MAAMHEIKQACTRLELTVLNLSDGDCELMQLECPTY